MKKILTMKKKRKEKKMRMMKKMMKKMKREELISLTWDHFLNQEESFCLKCGKNMSLFVLMA